MKIKWPQVWNKLKPRLKLKRKRKKPVKKNTLYRKMRAFDLRLDHRQQRRAVNVGVVDDSQRTCSNCGHTYTGRLCPQCGQAGTWQRYTLKQATLNFLDIWGLGNRPMFRTLRELFVRPGYMARDYLAGHRQFYFPPFKMLALVFVFIIFIRLLPGVEFNSLAGEIQLDNDDFTAEEMNSWWYTFYAGAIWLLDFLARNPLYEALFLSALMVVCIIIAFRPVSRYNAVETYIFLIFVMVQQYICRIPGMLLNGIEYYVSNHALSVGARNVGNTIVFGLSMVETVIMYFAWALLLLDFKQFYGLKWKSTVFRLARAVLVGWWLLFMTVFAALIPFLEEESDIQFVCLAFSLLILVPLAFWIAGKYFNKNEGQVSSLVIYCGKGLMLMSIVMVFLARYLFKHEVGAVLSSLILAAYIAVVLGLSLLPVYLYKKFRNTRFATIIAFIPVVIGALLVAVLLHSLLPFIR